MANSDVLSKKAAAVEWVAAVNETKSFGTWRYLIASEESLTTRIGAGEITP
ncbi:MAG: hypothetical protein ABIW32_06325 [Terrimesophilobacter sp.]